SGATKLFLEMAGCAPVAHPSARRPDGAERSNNKGFDWHKCVEAFGDEHVEQLSTSRGISHEICSWLHQNGLVGLFEGKIAFPVHDGSGKVVGAHYKTTAGSWQYYPKRVKAQPLVVGELAPGSLVHVFESQWDSFAFMDSSGGGGGILITRGRAT